MLAWGRVVYRIWDMLNWAISHLCAMIILFIMLTVCYEVIVRYFLNSPTSWSVEVNSYILVYLVFLMAGIIQRKNGHVQVDALRLKLPTKGRAALSLFNGTISLLSMLVLGWLSWVLSLEALREGARFPDMMQTPKFPVLVAVPIGLFLVSLHLLIQIYHQVKSLLGKTSGLPPEKLTQAEREVRDIVA